jgi:hypothetical protein
MEERLKTSSLKATVLAESIGHFMSLYECRTLIHPIYQIYDLGKESIY